MAAVPGGLGADTAGVPREREESGRERSGCGRVGDVISKSGLKSNGRTQAREDAACLVFLENEIADFAAQHADYLREKFVDITRKTWKKMSADGQRLALTIQLPPEIAELVGEAVGGAKTE